jgi:2-polyprenyl-3-methyl-5-hydroxy-6-metoxy-1,4-benzoquinol methylase
MKQGKIFMLYLAGRYNPSVSQKDSHAACKLCGSTQHSPTFRGILRCSSCNLLFFPAEINASELYSKKYFTGEEYHNYPADKKILQYNFRQRLKKMRSLQPQGSLLELGCAYGFFLELAKEHYQCKGIDISEAILEADKSLTLVRADFLTLPEEREAYDFICLWDTIEHLSEPFKTLKKASSCLKPGGRVVLTTGDAASFLAKLRGEKWRQIHPPTHLFYFTKATLEKALEAAGLKMESCQHVGQYRSYQSMLHGLSLRLPTFRWLFGLLSLGGKIDFPIYLNSFDLLEVIAIKPIPATSPPNE